MAAGHVTSLRQLAGELTTGITMLTEVTAGLPAGHRGYRTIQALPRGSYSLTILLTGLNPRSSPGTLHVT